MKKLFIFLILGILLVGVLGFFLFKPTLLQEKDIVYPVLYKTAAGNVLKDYDTNEKMVSLTNDETKIEILNAKLDTPQIYKVGAGYGMVAQFTINPYQDYLNVLGDFELYDKKNNNIRIERQIDIKYLTTQQVEENVYGNKCSLSVNGTEICKQVAIGTKLVEREVWLDFDNSVKTNEKIVIGLFTDVQVGDRVEWIPTIAGVKVQEWAVWTADLNVGLVAYYKLDETSGTTVFNSIPTSANGTKIDSPVQGAVGKIETAYDFDGVNDYVNISSTFGLGSTNVTINLWVYIEDVTMKGCYIKIGIAVADPVGTGYGLCVGGTNMDDDGNNLVALFESVRIINTNVLMGTGWRMVTMRIPASGVPEFFINGTSVGNFTGTIAHAPIVESGIGGYSPTRFFGNRTDEIGIWNRSLISAEITQLYNSGAGLIFGLFYLEITLLSPEDEATFTTNDINFSANVSDTGAVGIQNVTLEVVYPNGTLFYDETNTSGFEGIYNWTDINIIDGNWNWSVNTYDDANDIYESDMWVFNINTTPVINVTSPLNQTYTTSLIDFNATSSLSVDYWIINYNGTNISITDQPGTDLIENLTISDGSYQLLLYANNSESSVWGLNDTIYFTVNLIEPITTLVSPEDNLNTANATILFEANTTAGNYTLNNATIYVWFNNGTLFESETNNSIAGTSDANVSFNLSGFSLGIYKWNVQVNYENPDLEIYSSVFAENNRTLNIEATLSSITYNNHTYETKTETFKAEFDILPYSEISIAQLIYNGTNYTITNLTTTPTLLMLQKSIDIPLNLNSSANETKSFFFRFTYGGGFVQETENFEQNVSFINFQKCDATYNVQALNFTFFNEINQTNINATANPTTLESGWKYWIGGGDIYKTYSYQNLVAAINNYQFCIYPYILNNHTFRVDGDIEFSATGFRENEHHLRNATLTNVSNDNLLYLLPTTHATKFFLTFKKGTSLIKGATITIQKYFTGLGEFKTVGIQLTDDNGEATMWGEVDKTYKFFVVKDGELLGVVERNAICAVAPCTLSIIIEEVSDDPFESYYETFGQNIVSTLGFNKTSKIITYSFVDTTGLANYFRLKVQRVMLNETKDVICNSQSFSTAGTLTCNLTGKTGEFKATTYISRSPELIDKVLSVITDEDIIEGLGLIGVFLVMALIITIVFAAAIIGRGSPSVVLWALAGAIVLLKLAHLFPFTWGVVITLEVIIFFLISQVKT